MIIKGFCMYDKDCLETLFCVIASDWLGPTIRTAQQEQPASTTSSKQEDELEVGRSSW